MYFQKPGRKSEKPGKILKTWKKFRKPGENFQKSFGHSDNIYTPYRKPITKTTKNQIIQLTY